MSLTQVPSGMLQTTAQYYSMKNRIINGAMVIDQRNNGGIVTATSNPFSLDRWQLLSSQNAKFTAQQNAGSVTPPVGFSNYLGMTVSSPVSVGSGDYFNVLQKIEGFNFADLGFGTANAKTITISFWAYSSLTGSFGGAIQNSAQTRSYPFSYTISSANTWTQISVTIAGDTTGTWVGATNGVGAWLIFNLGAGSTYSGTANTWASANYTNPTGAVSVIATNGATFYLTGVQLEVGTQATSFDYRPYGTELALCQRYFEMSYDIGTAIGTASFNGTYGGTGITGSNTASEIDTGIVFKVTKRGTPTITYYDTSGNINKCTRTQLAVANSANQSVGNNYLNTNSIIVISASGSTAGCILVHFTASAEL